jgi:3,4-dihydroxy 2-butanone 4-phosphate synthase/GTP cyclohydrolase II
MHSIDTAIAAFRRGEFVMVMDRMERENECDLVLAAEHCTPEKMAFMIHWSTGIICVVSNQQRLEDAGLYPAAPRGNTDKNGTNFYVSTDFLPGTTTGVSAADRCATVRAFCDPDINPVNFSKPGHMFPLCAKPNGLRERDGHTEAAYDLCRLAGIKTVSIIGEMMSHDGTMMRLDECKAFAAQHGNIPLITVPQLKEYAERVLPIISPIRKPSINLVSSCKIRVDKINDAECTLSVFKPSSCDSDLEIVVLTRGDITMGHPIPLRIHSECFTGDILGSLRCDCGDQLDTFMSSVMTNNSPSMLVYVRGHEGRGIGLANKIQCYRLQDDEKLDTVEANLRLGFDVDLRSFDPCWEALETLFAQQGKNDWKVNLYTNNPDKILHARVARVVALSSVPNGVNNNYLLTKQVRLKHKTCIDTMKWEELLAVRTDSLLATPERTGRETKRVTIVAAKWNDEYVSTMVDACVKELGSDPTVEIERVYVPGAFDLIAGARKAASSNVGAIICIGVLIKGETDSYDHTCAAVSASLAHLNTKDGVPPIISGLLMYKTEQQANERLSDETAGKLGISWARSALTMIKQM